MDGREREEKRKEGHDGLDHKSRERERKALIVVVDIVDPHLSFKEEQKRKKAIRDSRQSRYVSEVENLDGFTYFSVLAPPRCARA